MPLTLELPASPGEVPTAAPVPVAQDAPPPVDPDPAAAPPPADPPPPEPPPPPPPLWAKAASGDIRSTITSNLAGNEARISSLPFGLNVREWHSFLRWPYGAILRDASLRDAPQDEASRRVASRRSSG